MTVLAVATPRSFPGVCAEVSQTYNRGSTQVGGWVSKGEGRRMDQGGVWASEADEGAREKEDRGKWGEE